MDGNLLYYGDNLDVLRRHIKDESVDLVYLDPPFNSSASYNVLFAEHGTRSAAQIHAFEDTWHWDEAAAYDYEQTVEQGGAVAEALRAFQTLIPGSNMLAYLSMMAPRVVELRRVMKPTATVYLHCDPTASHYLKVLMDAVFGPERFLVDIVWKRTTTHSDAKKWSPDADNVLAYSKGAAVTFNPVYAADSEAYRDGEYRFKDPDGRRFALGDIASPNPRPNLMYEWKGYAPPPKGWRFSLATMTELDIEGRIFYRGAGKRPRVKRYLDQMKGTRVGSVWTDLPNVHPWSSERLGYPTQKPVALLERILSASSNQGDIVLDPFCGCGTALIAAEKLGRRWVGIDITHLAIGLIKHRLVDAYGPSIVSTYRVVGEPTDAAGAQELAETDPFQFQAWALGLVGARIATSANHGGDKGIDGRLYFHDDGPGGHTKQIIFSVKAGHLVPNYVRDLRGVIEREKAEIGVLLTFETPTAGMHAEAATAGFYDDPWGNKHPRLQMLTVADLLDGRGVDYPHLTGGNVTHRRAPRELKAADQGELGYGETSSKG